MKNGYLLMADNQQIGLLGIEGETDQPAVAGGGADVTESRPPRYAAGWLHQNIAQFLSGIAIGCKIAAAVKIAGYFPGGEIIFKHTKPSHINAPNC